MSIKRLGIIKKPGLTPAQTKSKFEIKIPKSDILQISS